MARPSDIPPVSLGPLFETLKDTKDNQEHLPINKTITHNVWQTTGYQPKEPSQLEDAMRPRREGSEGGANDFQERLPLNKPSGSSSTSQFDTDGAPEAPRGPRLFNMSGSPGHAKGRRDTPRDHAHGDDPEDDGAGDAEWWGSSTKQSPLKAPAQAAYMVNSSSSEDDDASGVSEDAGVESARATPHPAHAGEGTLPNTVAGHAGDECISIEESPPVVDLISTGDPTSPTLPVTDGYEMSTDGPTGAIDSYEAGGETIDEPSHEGVLSPPAS